MTRILSALAEVAGRHDVLFCDLWGCVHNGIRAFPAAVAALRDWREGGGRVVLMTNAPRPAPAVVAGFSRLGLPREAWDVVVTSGDASRAAMIGGAVGERVHHIGQAKDDSFFTGTDDGMDPSHIVRVPLADAEGIVCTDLDDDSRTPEDYRGRLEAAAARGLPFLCTNPDIVVDLGERRLYCAGALGQIYEQLGGRVIYCGKPHPPIYALARRLVEERTGRAATAPLCVGDGILTDILGGVREGIATLFVTGGLAAAELGAGDGRPDAELLSPWLARHGLVPDYTIGALR